MLSTVGIQGVTEGGRCREEGAADRVGGPVGHVMGVAGGEGGGPGGCGRITGCSVPHVSPPREFGIQRCLKNMAT